MVVRWKGVQSEFIARGGVGGIDGGEFHVGGVSAMIRLIFHGTTIDTVSLGAAWPASLAACGCAPVSVTTRHMTTVLEVFTRE